MLKEFKEFALKGNVVDLAVGVIIGAAFNGIVTSLVKDIFTPILGFFTDSNVKISEQTWTPFDGVIISWGSFVQAVINFFLVALILFFFVKGMNKLNKKEEVKEKKKKKEEPSEEVLLLRDIRDSLKSKKK